MAAHAWAAIFLPKLITFVLRIKNTYVIISHQFSNFDGGNVKKQLQFTVMVRASGHQATYTAIGTDAAAVHMAAIDRFGVCAVTVKPAVRPAC